MTDDQIQDALEELRSLLREQWRQKEGKRVTKKFRRSVKQFLPRIIGRKATEEEVLFAVMEDNATLGL
jgi:hypothetical protein